METPEEIKQGNSAIVEIYPEYVIKRPKNIADTDKFIEQQMRAGDVARRVADVLKEMNLHINLPETTAQGSEIKETRVPGKKFDVATYNSLDSKTREKLANDLATFLIVMHQITSPEPMAIKQADGGKKLLSGKDILDKDIKRLFEKNEEFKETSLQNKIDRILNVSDDKNIKNLIRDAVDYIQNHNDNADNIKATRHRDLRDENMFYDQKTNSLGIIDFEGATVPGLIYEDFVGSPPSLLWDFEQRVIKHYNALSEQYGLGITINPEKIKNWLIYKTAWVAFKNNWPSERIAQHLKQIGLMAPDKVRAFENAIQKVSAKTDNIVVQNIYNFLEK